MNLPKNFEVKLPISIVPLYSDEKFNLVRVEYKDVIGMRMQIFILLDGELLPLLRLMKR